MAMSNGVTGGNFATLADLQASKPRINTVLQLVSGEKYKVTATDTGSGLLLANGNYAIKTSNPLTDAEKEAIQNITVSQIKITNDLASNTETFQAGFTIETLGFYSSNDGGGGKWFLTGGTGTASRLPYQTQDCTIFDANGNEWKLLHLGTVTPLQLGCTDDGVYSEVNREAMQAAFICDAKNINIAGGSVYACTITQNTENIAISANCRVYGTGTIKMKNTVVQYSEFFYITSNNVVIDGVNFVGEFLAGTTGFFFQLGGFSQFSDNVKFLNGSIDLQNTMQVSGEGDHAVHGFGFTRDFSRYIWQNWKFTRCNYATIKTNESTSTQKDILIDGCTFVNNVKGNLTGFNTPNGVCENVRIVNNNFIRDIEYFADVQDQVLIGGSAGGENFVISNNTAEGYGRDVIHFEETNGRIVVSDNVIKHLGGGEDGGITFRSNNVGTGTTTAKNIIVSNNVVVSEGVPVAGSYGIWFVWDGDGETGGTNINVTGNTIENYDGGIYTGDATTTPCIFSDNLIKSCNEGIIAIYPSSTIKNNTISNCNTVFRTKFTGSLGTNKAIDCVNLIDAEMPITIQHINIENTTQLASAIRLNSLNSSAVTINSFSLLKKDITISSGDNATELFTLSNPAQIVAARPNTTIDGQLNISYMQQDANNSYAQNKISLNCKDNFLQSAVESSISRLHYVGSADASSSALAYSSNVISHDMFSGAATTADLHVNFSGFYYAGDPNNYPSLVNAKARIFTTGSPSFFLYPQSSVASIISSGDTLRVYDKTDNFIIEGVVSVIDNINLFITISASTITLISGTMPTAGYDATTHDITYIKM